MSELRLRDHSQPCEHGFAQDCGKFIDSDFGPTRILCPGGKEVVLRQRFFPNGQWMYATERMGEPKQHIPLLEVEVVEE